jgi:hypothetical protein
MPELLALSDAGDENCRKKQIVKKAKEKLPEPRFPFVFSLRGL